MNYLRKQFREETGTELADLGFNSKYVDWLESRFGWISVEDELFDYGDTVILYDAMFNNVDVVVVNFDPQELDCDYTHWMPLPKPPER